MAVFALICPERRDAVVRAAEAANIPYYLLGSETLFVKFIGTTQELSDKLGISTGDKGDAVVMNFSSYYGWGPSNMWEWISVHWEG